MQTLKSFIDQSQLIWKDSTAAARIGLVLLLVICVGGIAGVGIWSTQPNYVILAMDLTPDKAGKIIDALDSAGIEYQVKGTGSIVLVDSRNLPRAQIAASKLGIRSDTPNLEDVTPWMDPLNQRVVFKRNLERQLVQSIESFPAVESANVHLNIPEKQHFIRHSNKPTAAIILTISPATPFGETQATSIANIVANSVSGLSLDNVSLTDTEGNEYATDESIGRLSKQEEYRVMRDRELAQKAESMLVPFLGFGNTRVEVATEFTFSEETVKSLELDPKKKVVISETTKNITESAAPSTASGVAGTGSNIGNAAGRSGKSNVTSKTEDLNSEYEASRTERQQSTSTPVLNRLSVSATINSTALKEDTPEERERIKAVIQNAVGFRDGTDQIGVEFFEFIVAPEAEAPAFAIPWDQINELLKNLSLGIAAIIAFFVARKAFKKMQPDPTAAPDFGNRDSQVNQLSELVKQNPEVFSKIIESWSSVDAKNQPNEDGQKRAA